jgi:hypothetical protein
MPHQPFPARQFSRIGLTPDEIRPRFVPDALTVLQALQGRLRVDDGQIRSSADSPNGKALSQFATSGLGVWRVVLPTLR